MVTYTEIPFNLNKKKKIYIKLTKRPTRKIYK
jgi:hypothetical protein